MHELGPKIHLNSPLAPQPVPQKLDSVPPSKGPFSANIHPIIPKLSVSIPDGMCFRKMVGGPLEKCTDWGQKSIWIHPKHPSRYPRNLIQCHLLRAHSPRIYIRSFLNFLCPYPRACAFGKWWGPLFENERLGAKNPSEFTLSTPAGTPETWFSATF